MTADLSLEVRVRRGNFTLDVSLTVPAGEIVAVLGPNGAGKSTLLGAIGGVLRLDAGHVRVGDRTVSAVPVPVPVPGGTANSRAVHLEPEFRRIGLLGQDPLLFPHLGAAQNIAFGLRAQGVSWRSAHEEALEWLDAVGLVSMADRKPAALSGGQQQRVAIARALAAHPEVLLLDEPLAALDVETAVQIRRLLAERVAESGTTTVLVTHDVVDALVLAPRCVIMQDGSLVDDGPIAQVLSRPRTAFVAALASVNLVTGRAEAGALVLDDGQVLRGTIEGTQAPHGASATAVFGFSAPTISAEDSTPVPGNSLFATVESFEPAQGGVRIRTRENGGIIVDVALAALAGLDVRPGGRVRVSVAPADVIIRSR